MALLRTRISWRALVAVAIAATSVNMGAPAPASADPPPEAAGTATHGFLLERGVVRTIDHPDARTIPVTPDAVTGTEIGGINDRGDMLGAYEHADGTVPHFVLDRKGRFVEIDPPPGVSGVGLRYETTDINNRGEITGFYNDDQGATATGFLRTRKGRYVDIDVPGSRITGALKLNDHGEVVGFYSDDVGLHGFIWDDGDYTTIDVPGAAHTIVFGINDRGQTVGNYIDRKGRYHAFLRERNGAVTTLPDAPGVDLEAGDATQPVGINDRGQIVGAVYYEQGGDRGFLYERGRYTLIDGSFDAVYTRALDVNDKGQIVGGYGTKPRQFTDPVVGFVLDRGRIDKIDLPGDGSFTVLSRITNGGRIVGKTPDEDGVGFDGLVGDVRGKLRRFEFPGAEATYAQGIDERGRIVGDASPGPNVDVPGATGYLVERGRYRRIAYPGAVFTQAFGINSRGQVVGEYLDQHGVFHGYRWARGRFTSFNGPLGTGASITDINDRGDMVGAYPVDPNNPLAGLRGFLLRNGKYTTFAALGLPGTIPFDINNRGQIAGTAIADAELTEAHGFLLAKGPASPATQIDVPGASSTTVFGLDDRGRIIGTYGNPDTAPSAQRSRAATLPLDALPLGLAARKEA